MMTVNEVCRATGVSVRTLHYYDEIGLLIPAVTTDAGYRMYDETNLQRLQQILMYRELEFPLRDIKRILDNPLFDKEKALEQQIELLILKKEHIEGLISHAKQIQRTGGTQMSFHAFDNQKLKEYADEAKRTWGNTTAYKEYEKKTADYSEGKQKSLANDMMAIFAEFGDMRSRSPKDVEVQSQVKKLQEFITKNYYDCTKQILSGLGQMYAAGGEMTDNIDAAGGDGTAVFTAKAIEIFCKEP